MGQAVSSTVQGFGALFAGKAEKKAYYAAGAAAEQEARYVDLQTLQSANLATARLDSALGAISAVRAARNLSLDSPTARVTDEVVRDEYRASIDADKLTGMLKARSRRDYARSQYMAGNAAKMGSYFKAAGNFIDAGTAVASAFAPTSKKG